MNGYFVTSLSTNSVVVTTVWLSGNALVSINVLQAWLILVNTGWILITGINHLYM